MNSKQALVKKASDKNDVNIQQESLVFNIIYIPGVTKYLEPFIFSLLDSTNCRFRLIANGCFKDEQLLLEEYCSKNPRLDYFLLSSDQVLTHCKALTLLQEKEESDYFCFMDADIFSRGPFLEELLPYLKEYSGVFSAYPIWCDTSIQKVSDDWPRIGGRHVITNDGTCLGGSYFAIYNNHELKQFIMSTGVTFSRYNWEQIPIKYQQKLIELGLKKQSYDTAKVLNILFQAQGHPLLFKESEALFHLGAMTGFFKGKLDRLFKGKFPNQLSLKIRKYRKFANSIKLQIKMIFRKESTDISHQVDEGYLQMIKTKDKVSRYFLQLLMDLSKNRPFTKTLDISNPEIERRVILATEGIKSIWKESGFIQKKDVCND